MGPVGVNLTGPRPEAFRHGIQWMHIEDEEELRGTLSNYGILHRRRLGGPDQRPPGQAGGREAPL